MEKPPFRNRNRCVSVVLVLLFILVRTVVGFCLNVPLAGAGTTPSNACTQSQECFTFEFLGYVDNGDSTTAITFRVTNTCTNDVSHIAIGTDGWTRILPPDNDTYTGDLGDYSVEWTGNTGNPGFSSIKFGTPFSGYSNGASDVFIIVVEDFDLDASIQVQGHAGLSTETFNSLLNNPECPPTPTATPIVTPTATPTHTPTSTPTPPNAVWSDVCVAQRMEITGIGMGDRSNTINPQTILLADPDNVNWLLAQVAGISPKPESVTFTTDAPESHTLIEPSQDDPSGYTFEANLQPTGQITASVNNPQGNTPRGLILNGKRATARAGGLLLVGPRTLSSTMTLTLRFWSSHRWLRRRTFISPL